MPRFVVLEHDHPELHWDFMLEEGGVLKTWRLAEFPPRPGGKVAALALADHRLAYLEYQGPVSGDRGQVIRRDQGTFTAVEGELTEDGPKVLALQGGRLRGIVILQRLQGDAWTLELREE